MVFFPVPPSFGLSLSSIPAAQGNSYANHLPGMTEVSHIEPLGPDGGGAHPVTSIAALGPLGPLLSPIAMVDRGHPECGCSPLPWRGWVLAPPSCAAAPSASHHRPQQHPQHMTNEHTPRLQLSRLGGLSRVTPDGNRVVLRHAPSGRNISDQRDRNEEGRCIVDGCGSQRHKLSSLCRRHYRNYENTGHPTARSIRRGTWKPWVIDAYAFVALQLRHDHSGINAGVAWCAEELFGTATRHDQGPHRPHTGYAAALARLRGSDVGPDELLARFIAAYAMREWEADSIQRHRAFANDRHFRHQAAKLLLSRGTIAAPRWARGNAGEVVAPSPTINLSAIRHPGLRIREFTFSRFNSALGVLALHSGREVVRRLLARRSPNGNLPEAHRVAGDTAPFGS
jgi:hypothetical protein